MADISRNVRAIVLSPVCISFWIAGAARNPFNKVEISLIATAVKNSSQQVPHSWMDYNKVVTKSSTFSYQLQVCSLQKYLCKWKSCTTLYPPGHLRSGWSKWEAASPTLTKRSVIYKVSSIPVPLHYFTYHNIFLPVIAKSPMPDSYCKIMRCQ